MSYTPTTWTTGDTITASALNKIENGIANAGVSGLVTDTSDTLDKTWNEINAMVTQGVLPFMVYDAHIFRLYIIDDSDGYVVAFSYPEDGEFYLRYYISSTATGTLVLD